MPKYCPICNRSSDTIEFIGEFCTSCYAKMQAEKLPKKIGITRCKHCGRIRVAGKFMEETHARMQDAIAKSFKGYEAKLVEKKGNVAKVSLTQKDTNQSFEADVEIEDELVMCPICTRVLGGYYEAVMQLRGEPRKIEAMAARVKRYFDDKGGYITKVAEVYGGVDLYLNSKSMTSAFISAMRLKATTSYTLYGLKNGKKVYRNTYAIHM